MDENSQTADVGKAKTTMGKLGVKRDMPEMYSGKVMF